jgi:hypothetical protein
MNTNTTSVSEITNSKRYETVEFQNFKKKISKEEIEKFLESSIVLLLN